MSGEAQQSPKSKLVAALPLIIFIALAAIFFKQLMSDGDKSAIPSALIGKQAPTFELVALEGLNKSGVAIPGFSSELFKGKVSIVNVWASWCVPCRQEHPIIKQLGEDKRFQLFGLNYKDKPKNALRFLGQLGNPYQRVGIDPNGKVSIDWGVYGIPETFIIGKDGSILHKHVGPLSPEILKTTFLPVIEQALAD
ncbi:MAG: DsbE family thiol:disulfide interchange protein [Hyphomicrobiales bacterium]|nr:MAG: DsbE family thiol:disulfide interchange protein [Hyphomicrobiales bacterium]